MVKIEEQFQAAKLTFKMDSINDKNFNYWKID